MTMTGDEPGLPVRPRRDWTARTRDTAFDARRYTKFVVRMKRVLSFSAFAIIFAVLAFFFVQRTPRQLSLTYEKLGSIQNDRAMLKPRLSGTDAGGNPFVITAEALVQDSVNAKRASLKNVEADLTRKDGWLNVRAREGQVDMGTGALALTGGIDVFTDTGYQLHTDSVAVNLKTNLVDGEREISGHGPLGNLRADRFRFDRAAGLLTLEGHVRTILTLERK